MKKISSILFLWFCVQFFFAQTTQMFLVETEHGYTYVDKDFKPILNKHFKFAGRFFEDVAVASENGYVGYINTKGNFVIKPEFEYALPFHHGVATVWKDGKVYLINKKGKILFEHNYRFIKYAVRNSFEPIFLVTTSQHKMGVINKSGKIIVDTIFNDVQPFCDGLSVIRQGNTFGVVNLQGKVVVPFGKYSQIGNFNSSRASVISSDWDKNTVGAIDKLGNLVFKESDCQSDWNSKGWDYSYWRKSYLTTASFYYEFAFSDSLAILNKTDESKKLIDVNGTTIYEGKGDIKVLGEGYVMVSRKIQGEGVTLSNSTIFNNKGERVFQNPSVLIEKAFKEVNGKVYFTNHKGEMIDQRGVVIPGIKPQNTFITRYHTDDDEYFIHNDLIIRGYRNYGRTDTKWGTSWYEYNSGFIFLDPDGFKQGLLYVIFYDDSYRNLIWGYLNTKGEIVYQNKTKEDFEQAVRLNLNYKEDQGWDSDIIDTNKIITQAMNPGKITLLLDSSIYEKSLHSFNMPTKKAYNLLRVFNETLDTLHWSYDFDQQISIQAKDKNGVWREIFTHIPSDVISDYKQHLAPNKFWDFHIQTYSGGFKTKMRVVVKIPELWNYEWDWGKGKEKLQDAKEFISNEIDCEINASQFVRDGFQKARFETFPFEDYEFQQFRPIG